MTAAVRHIHYRDDFTLRERFRNGEGDIIALPEDVDFELSYWVKHGRQYVASRVGGIYSNCKPDGDALLVIFKDHNLCEGTLRHELHLRLLNDIMPDGIQNVYYPEDMAVQLWHLPGDTYGVIESDVLAAYTRGLPFTFSDFTPEQLAELKGEKGDPFTYDDFTAAQIEMLMKPAVDAAKLATDAADRADNLTQQLGSQAQELRKTADDAVAGCNAATVAAQKAKAAADVATKNATDAAANANAQRELTEQSRQRIEEVAERAELAAAPVPGGLRVDTPAPVTIGNNVPRYINARILPASAAQNIIFQVRGEAADVEPDGRIVPLMGGSVRVHVIPTAATNLYRTITVQVVAPSLRLADAAALRLDKDGNIRLT